MKYVECTTATFARRNATGAIVHRICLDKGSPNYRKLVRPSTCLACKDREQTSLPVPAETIASRRAKQTPDERPPTTPGPVKRILTYTQAVAEWIAAGRPERSDEDVQHIYKELCEPCSWRKRRSDICRGCGCRVAAYGMAITNKIKMATQHCPREKW